MTFWGRSQGVLYLRDAIPIFRPFPSGGTGECGGVVVRLRFTGLRAANDADAAGYTFHGRLGILLGAREAGVDGEVRRYGGDADALDLWAGGPAGGGRREAGGHSGGCARDLYEGAGVGSRTGRAYPDRAGGDRGRGAGRCARGEDPEDRDRCAVGVQWLWTGPRVSAQ